MSNLVSIHQEELLAEARRERLARSAGRSESETFESGSKVARIAAVAAGLVALVLGVGASFAGPAAGSDAAAHAVSGLRMLL